ncbi:UDP-N-acetylmuramate dehydrogenase [Algibacter luteus]|uniref:UDP-N-acetylmuramate dehydrogenase n=1 Tax=Algibacter luteus TaxID=1178825 RepID=UPI00259590D1|nr:UDP-N-acetylmuramate dehydrogenase [Algibacter luteus]WJJ96152.1 UDP-N-acetylmuramate dehydrogenase [Algibacter luteus]
MQIRDNISLKPYNTFGIDVKAKHFVSINNIQDLKDILNLSEYPEKLIIGGGSNILLTQDFKGLVVHINIKGINIVSEDEDSVIIKANAGENWHEFVLYCINKGYGGVENLSLIPGNVGTAPIQNIGAYGVELKDTFVSCEAISIESLSLQSFAKADCNFGYRNSIFKQEAKNKYIITSVNFKLTKKNHKLNINYGAISSELEAMQISHPTINTISEAVINIRQSKLPNPKEIGNSGSFFKNPVISKTHYNTLIKNFEELPCYRVSDDLVKVPAGWLIEKAGFKGKRFGDYGVHKKQALVLVNYGNANGTDILNLSRLIQKTVKRLFDISIEAEVNIL